MCLTAHKMVLVRPSVRKDSSNDIMHNSLSANRPVAIASPAFPTTTITAFDGFLCA